MIYRLCRFENNEMKKYEFHSYEEFRSWIDQQLEEFKIKNKVRDESKDRYFINFKSELEAILNAKG